MFSQDDVEYRLPLAQVKELIHAGMCLDDVAMMWDTPELNRELAHFEAMREQYASDFDTSKDVDP